MIDRSTGRGGEASLDPKRLFLGGRVPGQRRPRPSPPPLPSAPCCVRDLWNRCPHREKGERGPPGGTPAGSSSAWRLRPRRRSRQPWRRGRAGSSGRSLSASPPPSGAGGKPDHVVPTQWPAGADRPGRIPGRHNSPEPAGGSTHRHLSASASGSTSHSPDRVQRRNRRWTDDDLPAASGLCVFRGLPTGTINVTFIPSPKPSQPMSAKPLTAR